MRRNRKAVWNLKALGQAAQQNLEQKQNPHGDEEVKPMDTSEDKAMDTSDDEPQPRRLNQ